MKITPKMLQNAKACTSQYDVFVKEWPKGCLVNKKNLSRAIELLLDLSWAVQKLLSHTQREVYGVAVDEAERIYGVAMIEPTKVYNAAKDEAIKVYNAAMIEAFLLAIKGEIKYQNLP